MDSYFSILFTEVYKILFLLVPVLVSVAMIVWLDRRVWAFVQKRRGPNVVGPFGLFQPFADALKLMSKETIIPKEANKFLFLLAPMITFILALIAWAVIPFDENNVLAELFKIMVNTFKKKKTKSSKILDEDSVLVLNNIIERFEQIIFVENSDESSVYNYNDFVLRNKIKKV